MTYNFAGGIEVGSPVRVSGIKVGKVGAIDFFVPVDPEGDRQDGTREAMHFDEMQESITPLRVKISVRKDAAVGVRAGQSILH